MLTGHEIGAAIVGSIIGSAAVDATHDIVDSQSPSIIDSSSPEIVLAIRELREWLKNQAANTPDIYEFNTIYKSPYGPSYQPYAQPPRIHVLIFSSSAQTLNVESPGLGRFNFALPIATWTSIDFPDGTAYMLDPASTVNLIKVWTRVTTDKP